MANWKLTDNAKSEFNNALDRLLRARLDAVERGVPLTPGEVIKAMMPPEVLGAIEIMSRHNATGVARTTAVHAVIRAGTESTPGTERDCLVHFKFGNPQYYVWDTQASSYTAKQAWGQGNYNQLPFHLTRLDVEGQVRFIKWLDHVLREQRLCAAVRGVARDFIKNHAHSLGEVQQRWPGLKLVFALMPEPWPSRMRDASRLIYTRWRWPHTGEGAAWRKDNQPRMGGADTILAGASLLVLPENKPTSSSPPALSCGVLKWTQGADRFGPPA